MRPFAEFFAGIGLVRLAAEKAGYTCVFANDLDPKKLEMYRANFGTEEFVLGDIATLNADQIPDIELATASFPCTDLSLAGSRAGLEGKQSSAVWPFLRLVDEMGDRRPARVLLENVPGLLSMNQGADLTALLQEMNRLGYAVDLWLVDASHFVPQSRVRLFVIGRRGVEAPQSDRNEASSRVGAFIEAHPEIDWDLRTMPPFPKRSLTLEECLDQFERSHKIWWSDSRRMHLIAQMPDEHLSRLVKSPVTAFRRVRKGHTVAEVRDDGLAGCLRTPKGGSARQIVLQHARPRLMTPRECARLMGAPDYKIDVADNQALFGFGDAVVVPAVEWVMRNAL